MRPPRGRSLNRIIPATDIRLALSREWPGHVVVAFETDLSEATDPCQKLPQSGSSLAFIV